MNNEFNESDQNVNEIDQNEAGVPIGVGDFAAASDFTTSEEPGSVKRHAAGALLITIVVAVAIIGLFSMRTLTRASAAVEAPSDLERSIEHFLEMINSGKGGINKTDEADSVLDVLSESYTQRQVSLSEVQRNPFIIFEGPEAAAASAQETVDPVVEQRRQRLAQFESAGNRLRLNSVLMGSDPLANINNKVLRIGDVLSIAPEDVQFTVVAIDATSVDLIAEDDQLEVKHHVTISIRREH